MEHSIVSEHVTQIFNQQSLLHAIHMNNFPEDGKIQAEHVRSNTVKKQRRV
jgi:hypothetical protein